MIPIKICGITTVEDAQMVIENGASAIGLIFYKDSSRKVSVECAKDIIKHINGLVPVIGVFVDETIQYLNSILSQVNIDILQLHGNESPQYCAQLNLPIIKVFRVGVGFDESQLFNYNVSAFLFDTYKKGLPGGTGDPFDWELISELKIDTPIILSGGLTPQNILTGLEIVTPSAMDVNSGVENSPGQKDKEKLIQLFNNIGFESQVNNLFDNIKNGIINV